jgi:hypothetical protein
MYQVELGRNSYSSVFSDPGGGAAVHSVIHICPHIACGKTEVVIEAGSLPSAKRKQDGGAPGDIANAFFKARIMPPDGCGKNEFRAPSVPEDVFRDYDEACRLLRVSPCASATYARRCLQAMVRKKFKLKPGKFQNEIKSLASMNGAVATEVTDALERVRKMGKFRAMPEDDVKVLVGVSFDEARQTIDVIEALLFDWFIAPSEREQRIGALRAILTARQGEK